MTAVLRCLVSLLPRSGPVNMAVDETLFRSALDSGQPFIRFYRWENNWTSFGRLSEVPRAGRAALLVRRPTGGGIVRHDGDLCFSAGIKLAGRDSYRFIHSVIRNCFENFKIKVKINPDRLVRTGKGENCCFSNAVRYDLLFNGNKIAGGAQLADGGWTLHQGSIRIELVPEVVPGKFASSAFLAFGKILGLEPRRSFLSAREKAAAITLEKEKYSDSGWTDKGNERN